MSKVLVVDDSPSSSLHGDVIAHVERIVLEYVLRYTDGNLSQSAHLLGISRGCLRKKIREHGICVHRSINLVRKC